MMKHKKDDNIQIYGIGKSLPGPGLGQAQKCGWIKQVIELMES